MKTSGYIRKVDDLGRIVIPKEIRKNLKISENDSLEIFSDSSFITMKKPSTSCVICGSNKSLITFKDKPICKKCINEISKN